MDGRSANVINQTAVPMPGDGTAPPVATGALSGAIAHLAQQGIEISLDDFLAMRNAIAGGRYPVSNIRLNRNLPEDDRSRKFS